MQFILSSYWISVLVWCNLFAIAAGSWDLLTGYAGQLSFGHSAFFGIGAYAMALAWKFFGVHPPYGLARICCWEPVWISNPVVAASIGAFAALLFALFLGSCAARVRGPALAILTFLTGLILQEVVFVEADITDGSFGITPGTFFPDIGSYRSVTWAYWGSVILLVAIVASMLWLVRSPYGVYFKCIRDDEIAAQAIGINPTKYKVMAFTISSVFCSLTGAYSVLAFGAVNPTFFSFNYNFLWIEMAVIGGSGTIVGAVFGSYFINILVEILRLSSTLSLVLFGIVFVIVLRFFPRGFMALLSRKRRT
jgi:branched-chain amino acid transport system permease protein